MAEKTEVKEKQAYITATGRRKEAAARVFLREGSGKITVNKRSFEDYFPRESQRLVINQPIKAANFENKLDVIATIKGGGVNGQAGALRHGISRAGKY